MAPIPSYIELGKQARDVFLRGYHFGLWKLDCRSKTATGIECTTGAQYNMDSSKSFGLLEARYKMAEHGLTVTGRWNTQKLLFADITNVDTLAKGLRLSLEGTFSPPSGDLSGGVKTAFTHEKFRLDADSKIDLDGPTINASVVVGHEQFLLGYQTAFDTQKTELVTNNVAIGYSTPELTVHANMNNAEEFGASVFHKANDQLAAAAQLAWHSGSNATTFGLGATYNLDKDALFRVKVNSDAHIGLGYQQKVRDNIVVTVSALLNGSELGNVGGHKMGIYLELGGFGAPSPPT